MTVRDADITRLARLSGIGTLPYRSFNNAPVRRAPAPPPEAPRPTATVLTLSAGGGEGAPVLRVIAGMGGLASRPMQVNRPAAEPPPMAPPRHPPLPGYGLVARALGDDVAPAGPIAAPSAPPAAQAGRTSFPLLDAALAAGGGSPWR